MAPTSNRDSATQLAMRIRGTMIDPSTADEARRPASDRPPGFADALMSEAPAPVEKSADLSAADWELIHTALEHYAGCPSG